MPFSLSLRGRVLALVALINLGIIAVVAWVLIANARQAVLTETAASLELAKQLAITAITSLTTHDDPRKLFASLPLHLQRERHVRITLLDAAGTIRSEPSANGADRVRADAAPAWFDRLIRPPVRFVQLPIRLDRTPFGAVIITAKPSDEIAEVWEDFSDVVVLMAIAGGALLVLVHLALGHALRPFATISQGLELLERGDFSVRIPPIATPDLKPLGIRFNALASTLEEATRKAELLSLQLVTLQDTERKNIALELHDEIGPCLFGITVAARHIQSRLGQIDPQLGRELAERAKSILDVVARMQEHSRTLLYRLRPMALGHVSLVRLLDDLVERFRQRDPGTTLQASLPDDLQSCGETVDLTLYRMIQECLTNAARHAEATRIDILLEVDPAPPCAGAAKPKAGVIKVQVSDNGRGFPSDSQPGLGLTGMSQRIRALGGAFELQPRAGGGTVVSARIPVDAIERVAPGEAAEPLRKVALP
jgi:two-component system sensor histidine kinase UhpB